MCVSNASGRHGDGIFARADGESQARGQTPFRPTRAGSGESLVVRLLKAPIIAYRWLISPWIGPRCRFLPTCSDYALDALGRHGAIRGGRLTVRRFLRCHPWGGSGFDPVPGIENGDRSAAETSSGGRPSGRRRPNAED